MVNPEEAGRRGYKTRLVRNVLEPANAPIAGGSSGFAKGETSVDEYAVISDVALILTGKNISTDKLNAEGEGLPYITGASCMAEGRLKCDRYCATANDPVISRLNDIIMSTVGTLGKLAVNDIGDCILSKHVCAVRFVPSILPEYGLLCIEASLAAAVMEWAQGLDEMKTGFSRKLDTDVIGNLPLYIIPVDRQRETVERMVTLAESFDIKPPKKNPGNRDDAEYKIPDFDNLHELETWIRRDSQRLYDNHEKALQKLHDFIVSL